MKRMICLTLLLFCSSAFAFDIAAYCRKIADTVGGSYQIEETCREMESKAQENLARKQIPARVETYCTKIGQAAGGSYQIMETCVEQELEAKSRLR